MIDPTREEWLAARRRLSDHRGVNARNAVLETILGPCPPEPPPEPFCRGEHTLVRTTAKGHNGVIIPRHVLTVDEADAMADALREHARYAREQGGP